LTPIFFLHKMYLYYILNASTTWFWCLVPQISTPGLQKLVKIISIFSHFYQFGPILGPWPQILGTHFFKIWSNTFSSFQQAQELPGIFKIVEIRSCKVNQGLCKITIYIKSSYLLLCRFSPLSQKPCLATRKIYLLPQF